MLRRFLIDNMWNRFQLDAFALSDISLAEFAHRILREKPKVLFGYASSLYEFARYIRKHPEWNIAFRGIISTSELLLSPVREYIESTFHCKIFDRYGTLELGGIGCECEAHTGLHISMENNYVEILTEGNLAKEGVNGDIVVTNLNNFGMPFIRYSIGDVGAWYAGDPCSCGRQSKRLKMVEGRLVDAFFTRDGRKVWSGFAGAGFRCLTHPTIAQFQIVQTSLDHMIVRLVPHGIITQSLCNEITNSIQIAFGTNVHTTIDLVNEIQPLASGKHQYAVSRMNEDIVLPDSHHKQATL
jgi:phenylacetate-CoA ligase